MKHNGNAEWLINIPTTNQEQRQHDIVVTLKLVKRQMKRIPNWKAAGPDGVQGFWMKNFSSLHKTICDQLQECMNAGNVPMWMTKGRTTLILKDVDKGNIVTNFRPITCLPLMWKLLTGIIGEEVYVHLDQKKILPTEQKGCRKNSRGTKDQMLIDKMIINNCKKRLTNLYMGWIDYKKAYDMVPHSWILECMSIYGIAENVIQLMKGSMEQWKTELTAGGKTLGEVNIKRGIFQGDSLSPILFVLCLIPLSDMLRQAKPRYSVGKGASTINHLLFMDDLKLYCKSEDELKSLIHTVRIFSKDIGMEFGVGKCATVGMKQGKMVVNEGIDLPNGETIKSLEEGESYKYLGVLQCDVVKHAEMKEKLKQEYYRRIRKILKSKLNGGNTISAINSRAVSIIRYGAGIIDWTKSELDQMDRKTRKLLTIYRSQHPQADVDRLYWKRSKGGRGLISVKECVEIEKCSLTKYVKESKEELIIAVRDADILKGNGNPVELKKELAEKHQQLYCGKKLHGVFFKNTEEIRDNMSWEWLKKGYLKKETEGLILAAQDQAIRTNSVKKYVDKLDVSAMCRMCGKRDENISHLVSECEQLAQKHYKCWRHDNVLKVVYWYICGKFGIDRANKPYEQVIDSGNRVVETNEIKLLWDFSIQTDRKIDHNKPDILLLLKKEKVCFLIDAACPFDTRVERKEQEKMDNYADLKMEILKIWKGECKEVYIIPIIIGALGTISRKFSKFVGKLELDMSFVELQKACLLGTSRIIRYVLNRSG